MEEKNYKEVAFRSNINITILSLVLILIAAIGIFATVNTRYIKEIIINGMIFSSLFITALGILVYNLMIPKVIVKVSDEDIKFFWHNKWRTLPLSEIEEINANPFAKRSGKAKVGCLSIKTCGNDFKLFCIKKIHQVYEYMKLKVNS